MTTKKYHVLVSRYDADTRWGIEGGSYVRAEVDYERRDFREHGYKASDLRIITCASDQAAIDAAVAALNAVG